MAQAYYEAKLPRPGPPINMPRVESYRRDENLPYIHKPKVVKGSPRKRKTWGVTRSKGLSGSIPAEEETPRKRGSWAANEPEELGPRLYNPQRSKLRDIHVPNFELNGYNNDDDSMYASTESLRSSRRQWSKPQKKSEVKIQEENGEMEYDDRGVNLPRIHYDRNNPSTSNFNPNYGGPPVPTNHTPNSDYYSYKYRSAKTKVPNNACTSVESQFGLTRTPEDKAIVFEPNVFGNSYQEMVYPSHYGGIDRSNPRLKGKKAKPSTAAQKSKPSVENSLHRSHSEIPKGMINARNVHLSKKFMKKSEDLTEVDDDRSAKYTHTIEEPKLVTSEEFRPAKYTYTKEEQDASQSKDDERPAKYTYTVSSPPAKDRTVKFHDDIDNKDKTGNGGKNSSSVGKQNGILKPGPQKEVEKAGGRALRRSDQSNASTGRKKWSSPVAEIDDPRQFWVDMGNNGN